MTVRRALRLAVGPAVLVLLVLVPKLDVSLGKTFTGPLSSPGTLQLLALCLVFGGLALSYDLLFGWTGLLSFGHALYFAAGVYVADIAITEWHWSFAEACLITAGVGLVLPLVVGTISLRTSGIAFAMVTLAFAQAGGILVQKNPHSWTGGDQGLGYDYTKVPAAFVGVANTKNLYWLALGYAVSVFLIVGWAVRSSPGHVWQAIRENERRVEVLGLRTRGYKLYAFVVGSFLATAGGVVYLLVVGGAEPSITTPDFTLILLVMVVLGGTGTLWGPVLGAALYWYADQRLNAVGGSHAIQSLPAVLRVPLSQPLFVLGTLFILVVFFLPGGIVGIASRGRAGRRGLRRLEEAVRPTGTIGGAPETGPSEPQEGV
jgi:branched-chain amino acid transport system permease protein